MLRRHPALPLYLASLFFALMGLLVKVLTGAPRAPGSLAAWLGSHDVPAMQVVFYRSLIPFLMYLPAALAEARARPREMRASAPLLALRGISGAAALVCYFLAIERVDLSVATVLTYTSPLWATLFAAWFLREGLPARLAWAMPLTLAGVVMITRPDFSRPGDPSGYALALGAGILAGVAYAAVRRLTSEVSTSTVVVCFSGMGMLFALPWMGGFTPTPLEMALLAGAGVTGGLAQYFMTLGYRWATASRASTLTLAAVVFTVLLAVPLLGERPDALDWAGLALTLVGVAAATPRRPEAYTPPPALEAPGQAATREKG